MNQRNGGADGSQTPNENKSSFIPEGVTPDTSFIESQSKSLKPKSKNQRRKVIAVGGSVPLNAGTEKKAN